MRFAQTLPLSAASALPGDTENCLAAGMDGLITKPYTQAQLRAAIEQWTLPKSA